MTSINVIHHQCHYVTIAGQSVDFCHCLIHCQSAASAPGDSHQLQHVSWWTSCDDRHLYVLPLRAISVP